MAFSILQWCQFKGMVKFTREIIPIIESTLKGNIGNRFVGMAEQPGCMAESYSSEIIVGGQAGMFLYFSVQGAQWNGKTFRQFAPVDLFLIVFIEIINEGQ
ncbi:hypothetical protein BFW41_17030 [Aeromonas hydrophila]|nr:hypothetical protein BFW41_17030 [Aeromonas hydrophila]